MEDIKSGWIPIESFNYRGVILFNPFLPVYQMFRIVFILISRTLIG